jgi:tetratricopeptide (TPR) repeat protein
VSGDPLEAAVAKASGLLGRDAPLAEREARAILIRAPGDPRGQLILASALRRQGRAKDALAILAPLAKAYPRAAHTQFELGMAQGALGHSDPALQALRQAIVLNPRLAEAWRALGDLLFQRGDEAGAQEAFAQHSRASVRNPALGAAADALYGGRLDEAERRLRDHLTLSVGDTEAMRLLAETYERQGRFADAETLLVRALEREPSHHGMRFTLANVLFQQQKAPEALPHLERLLALDPADPAYRNLLAGCLALVGDFDRAIEINQALLTAFPRQPRIWLNHGHALRTVGRRAEAVEAYRRAIALSPSLGDAYWSLANLKVAPLSAADEAAMAAQLQRPDLATDDRLHLHYALGKALEDRGDDAGAMANYLAGAELRRQISPYDSKALTGLVERSKALFTVPFLNARPTAGSPRPDPIFILGLPRSGSTLIEQILASHSAVEGVMELPDMGVIAEGLMSLDPRAGEIAYPDVIARLSGSDLMALGELYIERTRIHRRQGRTFFIDKMPNNFRHVGLILLSLPKAKIIDARRHPLGACFSAFKQHFHQGQNFSYDLTDLGLYYRDYVDLMAHFDTVAPGRVTRVIYEDLVEDTEGQVRRLLDACGLPFEAACLSFHENPRAVRTVSSEQVRRPIFREGLNHWRRFEPWLEPLKVALGPALEGWRG